MRIDIISLFPELIEAFYRHSIIGRARAAGLLELDVTNPRNFTYDRHHMVDDTIYGGGCGMLMKAGPLFAAVEAVRRDLCGHYEGVDYRVEESLADETISVGDYVLTGGELPAMTITDAVARMIPGVLGAAGSAADDSFYASLLEYPQYTKPAVFRGLTVPEVLRNGDHAKIDAWRRRKSLERTLQKRPDLLETCDLSAKDKAILAELEGEEA